jgi:hypothetical protein
MVLKRFEAKLERLVEGSLTRPFKSQLQPIEIGRRLTREMDLARRVGTKNRVIAPNIFEVRLSPDDVERFEDYVDALVRELAEAAREHASMEHYHLLGPVEVDIFENPRLKAGDLEVTALVREGELPVIITGPDGTRLTLSDGQTLVIGRLPECDITINDASISRRHAQIVRHGDAVSITDLGSTNGTTVNGSKVQRSIVVSGDEIGVGAAGISVEIQ